MFIKNNCVYIRVHYLDFLVLLQSAYYIKKYTQRFKINTLSSLRSESKNKNHYTYKITISLFAEI